MMSRSLGPEFGIPVGIILLLSSVGLSVMYATGLVEYIIGVTKLCMLDCSDRSRYQSIFIIGVFVIHRPCFIMPVPEYVICTS